MPIKFIPHRRAIPAPAPPFASNSAVNGLSVDPITGQIVFGQDQGAPGDPAQLLSFREIPMNGFGFSFGIPGDRRLVVDLINNVYALGDYDNATAGALVIDGPSFSSGLYATDGFTNAQFLANTDIGSGVVNANLLASDLVTQMQLTLDHFNDLFYFDHNSNRYLEFDFPNMRYSIGDIGGANNGTFFQVDDFNGIFNFDNGTATAQIFINGTAGFTGTVTPVNSITVDGGIVTAVS